MKKSLKYIDVLNKIVIRTIFLVSKKNNFFLPRGDFSRINLIYENKRKK